MDANVSALLVAVIGVGGTFGAAFLTQIRADRLRRYELAHTAEEQRQADARADAERAAALAREDLAVRRACYAATNTAARQYLTALIDYRHALEADGAASPESVAAAAELESCRSTHRDGYSEAQMIVRDGVLEVLGIANYGMNRLYGLLRRIAQGTARPGETLQTAIAMEQPLWGHLRNMRLAMRRDLGVDAAADGT